jgi:hypothetical protein
MRPGKLFTASTTLMVAEVAAIRPDVFETVLDAAIAILRP